MDLKDCEKSFTLSRDGSNWYFVTNYTLGDKLIKQDRVGPTMRAIVIDEFKIEAQRYFDVLESR